MTPERRRLTPRLAVELYRDVYTNDEKQREWWIKTVITAAPDGPLVLATDYDRDLADMTRQRDEAVKRMEQLKAALDELVALKDWKDKHGKDMRYQRDQPVAWEKARTALAAKEPSK